MKKFLTLLLVLVMVLSFAACGDKDASAGNGEPSNPQSSSETENTPSSGAEEQKTVAIPEGMAAYCNQGAVILYPTDTYKEYTMGGIQRIEGETPWIRISISGDNYEEQKALFKSENSNASDYSLTEITVGDNKALKCIYSDSAAYFMEVYIDTAFIGDEFWSGVIIKVEAAKHNSDMSVFDDADVWEIINSFYFDPALKYQY